MDLNQKNILFISALFFNYEEIICERLTELSANLDFYNERPSENSWVKGIIRVYSPLLKKKINAYYQKILNETQTKNYDYFILIKGESIPDFFLIKFRKQHPDTRMIYVSYDTVAEYPKTLKLKSFFDFSYSFEPTDVTKYGFIFRPNFYLNDFLKAKPNTKHNYDLAFVGSAHTDRYLIVEKLKKILDKKKRKSFFYYYAPNRVFFLLKLIFDKSMQSFDISKLSFKKLSHAEVAEIYQDTFAVLDINKPFQSGLSMRLLDSLASRKKVITTNSDVRKYPFYNPKNILVIDRERPEIPDCFFEICFQEMPDGFVEKCSLDSWIFSLLTSEMDGYWDSVFE